MARRNYRARVSIKIDLGPLQELRRNRQAVLHRLDEPCRQVTNLVLDQSLFLVPRGGAPDDQLDLADTAFKDGPLYNPGRCQRTRSDISSPTNRLTPFPAIFAPEVTTPVSVTVAKVGAALAALR